MSQRVSQKFDRRSAKKSAVMSARRLAGADDTPMFPLSSSLCSSVVRADQEVHSFAWRPIISTLETPWTLTGLVARQCPVSKLEQEYYA